MNKSPALRIEERRVIAIQPVADFRREPQQVPQRNPGPATQQLRVFRAIAAHRSALRVDAADADHGVDLAKRWCASCHVVADGQTQASVDVPSFASVARRPNFSPERLAFFLLDPHPKMPNFPLSRLEAADIAAYIDSLRK